MKKRTDFVTNSSSSSYIFGTAEDTDMTLDSVYKLIRSVYLDMIAKAKDMAEQKEKWEQYGISVIFSDKYNFKVKVDAIFYKSYTEFSEDEESIINDVPHNLDWLECETYEEYKKRCFQHGWVFVLLDFADDRFTGSEYDLVEAIYWYGIDIDCYYLGNRLAGGNCEKCHDACILCRGDEKEDRPKCLEMKKKMEDGTVENQLLMRFGRIILLADHELQLPNYVHKHLGKMVKYGCNHMG